MADRPRFQSIVIQPPRVLIEGLNGENLSAEKGEKIPSLFFRFDEVSSTSRQMCDALNRVTRLLWYEPGCSFAQSTGSAVFGLSPEVRAGSVGPIGTGFILSPLSSWK